MFHVCPSLDWFDASRRHLRCQYLGLDRSIPGLSRQLTTDLGPRTPDPRPPTTRHARGVDPRRIIGSPRHSRPHRPTGPVTQAFSAQRPAPQSPMSPGEGGRRAVAHFQSGVGLKPTTQGNHSLPWGGAKCDCRLPTADCRLPTADCRCGCGITNCCAPSLGGRFVVMTQ
jgi:hypothetical protein